MDFRKIMLSCPTVSVAAVAMEMLWGEMILPAVAPMVLAATSQTASIPRAEAVSACRPLNSTEAEVALPVTKVPMEPMRGATMG